MRESVGKRANVVRLKRPSVPRTRVRGHVTGRLAGLGADGPYVDYPGNRHGPLLARTTVEVSALRRVHEQGLSVLLVFEHERSDQPIIVAVLTSAQPTEAVARPELVALASSRDADAERRALPAPETPIEARVDGRRVVLEAQDEIVLRCGEASITLRRNGRIVLRGAYVETRSRGVVRIKGGSVQVN